MGSKGVIGPDGKQGPPGDNTKCILGDSTKCISGNTTQYLIGM